MDEFDNGGQLDMCLALIAKGPGTEQHNQWPQAFAATVDNIMAELVDEGDI